MEFFASAGVRLRDSDLQRHVRIDNLPQWCASIDRVLEQQGEHGTIYCVWGEFAVRREVIGDGVRFSLPGCPNALQWTVTAGASPGPVVIHCTINRREADGDFVESLEQFVADWKGGLEQGPKRLRGEARPVGECMPWYG